METRMNFAVGKPGKMVSGRLLPGTDLLTGLEEMAKQAGIKYGAVWTFGSFRHAGYMYMVPMDAKVGSGYGDVAEAYDPIEFLGGLGIITQTEKGETELHFHGTLCDKEGKVFGGHMVKGENEVLTTNDVIMIENVGVEMIRKYDEETDLTQVFIR